MLNGLLAVEPTEWTAGAIIALLVTNAGTLYKLIKGERRADSEQEEGRDNNLVASWRAWGKTMEKGRVDAEKRERIMIAEASRLAEVARQSCERIEQLEAELKEARGE